ncbi:S-adenosyl-L-methionine-dependent methyltransferase [Hesseltinella vesiculosa]|uniref:S-adenosyl-L-methionine-dependent methyltransferase n=1 Tax=Hesseltinella vesiculosa TaxID=101127 RepID=A0A1X2GN19_9FUNG|nr:S-adenosyl-L-methionine-dependent methyltransferase [Hesseltinella vesiculosa]
MGIKFSTSSRKRTARTSSTESKQASSEICSTSSVTKTPSKIQFGRSYHDTKSSYWFPNDDEENDRLMAQHFAIKALWGGNISPSIQKYVPLERGANVLDVGCASGTWVLDTATEFPASHFTGIDITDTFPTSIKPNNTEFKIGNLQERLPFPDNTFDLINLRFFILALKSEEWNTGLVELFRILKPGGVLQCIECGMLEGGTDFMLWAGAAFEKLILKVGQEPWISLKLPQIMSQIPGVEVIENRRKRIPLNNVQDPLSRDFLYDIIQIFQTAQPYLIKELGIPSEQYPAFIRQLAQECQNDPPVNWSFVLCAAQKTSSQ